MMKKKIKKKEKQFHQKRESNRGGMKGQLGKKLALIQKKEQTSVPNLEFFSSNKQKEKKFNLAYIQYMYTSCPMTGALWARILI